jgi:hypothetical protein
MNAVVERFALPLSAALPLTPAADEVQRELPRFRHALDIGEHLDDGSQFDPVTSH